MPEIHYTDAILTILFAAGMSFMIWSSRMLWKHDNRLVKMSGTLTAIEDILLAVVSPQDLEHIRRIAILRRRQVSSPLSKEHTNHE